MQMPPPTGVAPVSAARLPQREQSPAPFSGRGVPPRPVAKQAEVETEPETKFGGVPVAKKAVSAEGEADQGAQSSASGGTASQGTKKRQNDVPSVSTPTNKRSRTLSSCSSEALALGYELGTIKHAAYVLLTRAGDAGLTVSAIVEHATKEGMYSWGTCKTPNNSVTAALSQDQNFCRVAPSTYALRTHHLRPVGAAAQRESRHAAASTAERAEPRASSHHNLRSTRERREVSDQGAASDDSGPSYRMHRVDSSERYGRGPLSRAGSHLGSPLLSARRREAPLAGAPSGEYSQGNYASDGYRHRGDSKAVLRDDAFDPSEPRLLPIREMGGNSAAQTDLHAVNSPESPSTPTDVTSLRPQYPPNLHNAASCLFLFPVAHPYVPQRPADSPGAPTEAEARADAWREEVAAALARSGKSVSPPKQMKTQLPPWVFEAIRQEREESSKEAAKADSDCGGSATTAEGPAGAADAQPLDAAAPMLLDTSSSPPPALGSAAETAVSLFSPLAAQPVVAGCA